MCVTMRHQLAEKLKLVINPETGIFVKGFGAAKLKTLGEVQITLKVDKVSKTVVCHVVPDWTQDIDIIVGQPFTEDPAVGLVKDDKRLDFFQKLSNIPTDKVSKYKLYPVKDIIIPPNHIANVPVLSSEPYAGEIYIETSLRSQCGSEHLIPALVLTLTKNEQSFVPVVNLSDHDLAITKRKILVRGFPCEPEKCDPIPVIARVEKLKDLPPIPVDELNVGPITPEERLKLVQLLNEYRDCFAQSISEIGQAKNVEMKITLIEEKPFTYRPYRLAEIEKQKVRDIIGELLENNIIEESQSPYASPILLVKKKDGDFRMCIDYRKLNSLTIKDRYPLPRIDDHMTKLSGQHYFTSLDMTSGYHQIPMATDSKKYTAFVTPEGQFVFNRMPFGLTNAPATFSRFMNKILAMYWLFALVYLDDILLFAKTVAEMLQNLETILKVLRREGLTLKLSKCFFLQDKITYLGYEIFEGKIRPGENKTKAIATFQTPKNIHQVRQFLGLTGFFRNFVKNYAEVARPITALLKKNNPWNWTSAENEAFDNLKAKLSERPILLLYNPEAKTEVHTDASKLGLGGILMQYHNDKLHPVAYYSRQTNAAESRYHSYELETLAVVESIAKFRVYLLGLDFTVVTDCNALKTAGSKRDLIPRIGRWWLQLQEYRFNVQYRPGKKMGHVDALSRNPGTDEAPSAILHLEMEDWILSAQMADQKIASIKEVLSKPPKTKYEKDIYKKYALRNNRLYRITVNGIQWVVPRGMRHEIVRRMHDEGGHFSAEKTLQKTCATCWFPRMRSYIEKFVQCCVPCIYNKIPSGRKEGFLHPIAKEPIPFYTLHVDHLGPYPKSHHGKLHIIVVVDAFTKFVLLRATKSTSAKRVIKFFEKIFGLYGYPHRVISDRGTAFTSKRFTAYLNEKQVKHVRAAVATPRANGQVERINRIIKGMLPKIAGHDEENWDKYISQVQLAINTTINSTTKKTPHELLMGYRPKTNALERILPEYELVVKDLEALRTEADTNISKQQLKQKKQYDRKRGTPVKYKKNDQVVIRSNPVSDGTSRKMKPKYKGPMTITKVLPNDRYRVKDLPGSVRSKTGKYDNIIAVDRMKPWIPQGGISDSTDSESGSDGVPFLDEESEDGNNET